MEMFFGGHFYGKEAHNVLKNMQIGIMKIEVELTFVSFSKLSATAVDIHMCLIFKIPYPVLDLHPLIKIKLFNTQHQAS